MIKSIGLDIVDSERIDKLKEKFNNRFHEKILGADEMGEFNLRKNQLEYLAGRFAAKEALIKVLGAILITRPGWHQLQIINNDSGFPVVEIDTGLLDLDRYKLHITISHDKNIAAAVAVLEEVK